MWGQPPSAVQPSGSSAVLAVKVTRMPTMDDEFRDHPPRQRLKFRWLTGGYAIVRLAPDASAPEWAAKGEFTSITRTADELSIVCPAENLPRDVNSPQHWICLTLEGPFDFSQTGVLLSFIEPLSSKGIPILTISTYDTDYVLIQEEWVGAAIDALQQAGHELWPGMNRGGNSSNKV